MLGGTVLRRAHVSGARRSLDLLQPHVGPTVLSVRSQHLLIEDAEVLAFAAEHCAEVEPTQFLIGLPHELFESLVHLDDARIQPEHCSGNGGIEEHDTVLKLLVLCASNTRCFGDGSTSLTGEQLEHRALLGIRDESRRGKIDAENSEQFLRPGPHRSQKGVLGTPHMVGIRLGWSEVVLAVGVAVGDVTVHVDLREVLVEPQLTPLLTHRKQVDPRLVRHRLAHHVTHLRRPHRSRDDQAATRHFHVDDHRSESQYVDDGVGDASENDVETVPDTEASDDGKNPHQRFAAQRPVVDHSSIVPDGDVYHRCIWHSREVHEADKHPEPPVEGPPATRGVRDVGWVIGVGLAPLLLLALTTPAVVILGSRDGLIPAVLSNWNLYAVFGLVIFAPIMVVSCIGALVMISRFRAGRWISTAGNVATAVSMAILVYAGTADLVVRPADPGPDSWVSALTPVGTVLFVVPYVALLAANLYVIRRLWRQ